MKIYIYFLTVVFSIITPLNASFYYDRAIYTAQKGDVQTANELLQKIIVDCPDDAQVVYDAGLTSYNLNNFKEAATYFVHAASCAHDKKLQFQSYFNAANASIALKDLKKGLDLLNKALDIQPDNQYARYNRDRVVDMLKEQEQQRNEKENENNNDTDNKEDKKDKENTNNSDQKKDQKNSDNSNKNDNSKENQSDEKNSDDESDTVKDNSSSESKNNSHQQEKQNTQSEEKQSAQNSDNTEQSKESKQREDHRNKKEQQQNYNQQEKRDNKDNFNEKTSNEKEHGKNNQSNQHDSIPGQEENISDKSNLTTQDTQEKKLDTWLAKILEEQELKDKMINKQLMEAKIHQNGGTHENGW